ncbi:NAD(P)-binding protein [Auriculariales sp. MPI-PUGE-AT-0066]|nr:NAD(P)-binding protein [Auriculariales sp. MPI-PUGE-AT-0066]
MSDTFELPGVQKRWIWPGSINGVDGLELIDDVIPQPSTGEVLVRIHAVSLNFRELLVARGLYGKTLTEGLTPGCDPAGEIVAVGPGQEASWIGQRVTASFYLNDSGSGLDTNGMGATLQGTLMQYRVFPASAIVRIADSLTYEEAAAFGCAGVTAFNALLGGPRQILPGETVVVQGTGGVACFACQIARASGARVILTSSSDTKLAQIQKLIGPVDATVNYKTHPEWHENVLSLTNGRGADLILDMGGNSLPRSLKALAPGGTIAVIGILGAFEATLSLPEMIYKTAVIRAIAVGTRQHLIATLRIFDLHNIKPVIARVFQLGEAKEALNLLDKQDFIGKIVIKLFADPHQS